jgi:hypothetical protein
VASPTCTAPTRLSVVDFDFVQYYKGSGFTENPDNEGNQNPPGPPDMFTYPGTMSVCDAVQACNVDTFNAENNDYSFDIYYLISTSSWLCVGYYQEQNDPSAFNIANPDVREGYGYDIVIT